MGYRVHTFSPDTDTPTGQVADIETSAAYDDLDAVRRFAKGVDVVTGQWADGRVGTFRGIRDGSAPYGFVAFSEKGVRPVTVG